MKTRLEVSEVVEGVYIIADNDESVEECERRLVEAFSEGETDT